MQKQAKERQLHHQQQQIGRAVASARSSDLRQRPDTDSPLLAQAGGKRRRGAAVQLRCAHLAYIRSPDPAPQHDSALRARCRRSY